MTKEELLRRLGKSEWSDFEYKKSQRGVSEDTYSTVSAFANTSGGTIVFGVQDTHGELEPIGVLDVEKVSNDFDPAKCFDGKSLIWYRSRQVVSRCYR